MAAASQLLLPAAWLVDATPPGAYTLAACGCVVLGFVVLNLASQPRAGGGGGGGAGDDDDTHACHRTLRVPLLRTPRAVVGSREATTTATMGAEGVEAEAEAGAARGCRPPHQLPSSDSVMRHGERTPTRAPGRGGDARFIEN